jgi:hypothetical protein
MITPASSAISSVRAVVRVTAQALGLVLHAIEDRAEVGDEAVVADDQFVELSAGGDVLVFEDGGAGDVERADELLDEFFHHLSGKDFRAGEEVGNGGKTMIDCPCLGRGNHKRLLGVVAEVDAFRFGALTLDRPEHVGEAHLARRQLAHDRDFDIAQPRVATLVRRDARERPRGTLVVHDPARAIDRIDDDADLRILLLRALRKNLDALFTAVLFIDFDPFRDEHERRLLRPVATELFEQRLDVGIDLVNRVGDAVAHDFMRAGGGVGADDDVADQALEIDEAVDDLLRVARASGDHRSNLPGPGARAVEEVGFTAGLLFVGVADVGDGGGGAGGGGGEDGDRAAAPAAR